MARTQRAADKRLGTPLVEQPMREATRRPPGPGGDTLFDVSGQLSQVVPELHDASGATLHELRFDWYPPGGSLDQPPDGFRTLSMMLRSIGHFFSIRSIIYREPAATCTSILQGALLYRERCAPLPENELIATNDKAEVTAT